MQSTHSPRLYVFWKILREALSVGKARSSRRRSALFEPAVLEDRALLASITVTSLADNTNSTDGLTTLREAILSSNTTSTADTITFASGLIGAVNLGLGTLAITQPVTITGLGAANTAIDGQGASRLIDITNGQVVIEHLTLRRGHTSANNQGGAAIRTQSLQPLTLNQVTCSLNSTSGADSDGAAVLSVYSSVMTNSCEFADNATTGENSGGGAIAMLSGNLIDQGSVFQRNSTAHQDSGGGAIASSMGTITLTGSTLSDNVTSGADSAGGAVFSFGDVSLIRAVVTDNSTTGRNAGGGAIFADGGSVRVSQSTLSGNTTAGGNAGGGAIYSTDQPVLLSQSTVSGNTTQGADSNGGAVFVLIDGAVTISQSTVVLNQSVNAVGGGVFADASAISVTNSIVALNTDSGTAPNLALPTTGSLTSEASLIGDGTGAGLTATGATSADSLGNYIGNTASPIDPLLGPLQNNGGSTFTHGLLTGSLALNHGNNNLAVDPLAGNAALTTDQRGTGYQRITGASVDMGAVEVSSITYSLSGSWLTITGTEAADSIRVVNVGGQIKINVGTTTLSTGVNLSSITGIVVQGLGGSDSLRLDSSLGTGVAGSLLGGDGDDLLFGGLGRDTINGGNGNDLVTYIQATSAVRVSLASTALQNTRGSGYDQLIGVEGLIGSSFNDTLTGSAGPNLIDGGSGNDALTGGQGTDSLIGGVGNDTLYFDHLDSQVNGGADTDKAIVSGATSAVSLNLTVGQLETVSATTSVYHNLFEATGATWAVSITGGSGNDTIIGGTGNDALYGKSGADDLQGGLGGDRLYFDSDDTVIHGGAGRDYAMVNGTTGAVSLDLALGQIEVADAAGSSFHHRFDASGATWPVTINGGAGRDTLLGGTMKDSLLGGTGDDSIVGNGGNDVLTGSGGADTLLGGDGNDSLRFDQLDAMIKGGTGSDTATVAGATAAVSLNLTTSEIEAAYASSSIYHNLLDATGATWRVTITGGTGNDTIRGGQLNDRLTGGDGNDTITGNAGNDTLAGGNGNDTVNYSTATSGATVNLTTNTSSGGAGTDLLSGFENIIGSIFNDQLTGDLLNNIIHGGGGIDTIVGGGGLDQITTP